jgi:hypothetical protein
MSGGNRACTTIRNEQRDAVSRPNRHRKRRIVRHENIRVLPYFTPVARDGDVGAVYLTDAHEPTDVCLERACHIVPGRFFVALTLS